MVDSILILHEIMVNIKNSGKSDDPHVNSSGVKQNIPETVTERFYLFVFQMEWFHEFISIYIINLFLLRHLEKTFQKPVVSAVL